MAADQPLQGSDAAVMEWVCQGCGTHNADPMMLSHPKFGEDGARCHGLVIKVPYVPLSVAEKDDQRLIETLARVIENRHGTLHGIGSTLREALAEYRREETT